MQILEKHKSLFTDNFEDNKIIINKVAIIRSKQLKNKIVGYATYLIKQEKKEAAESESKSTVQENI